jgi:hypothetical protein
VKPPIDARDPRLQRGCGRAGVRAGAHSGLYPSQLINHEQLNGRSIPSGQISLFVHPTSVLYVPSVWLKGQ